LTITLGSSDALAKRLLDARKGSRRVRVGALGSFPNTHAEAFATQTLVTNALGPVAAFKTARRPADADLIAAPIYRHMVRHSPAVFETAEIGLIGIELELAFLIEQRLPEASNSAFADLVRNRVSLLCAIEVCDTRLDDFKAASTLQKLADNQLNGGLVVGKPLRNWQAMDMSGITAKLVFGDKVMVDGRAEIPGGDAFETFLELVRRLGPHCGGLQPGHYVITGSVNGLPFIERGTPVFAKVEGLGELHVTFPV
jgi:2-keto-4-pentenoate hydratase